MKKFVVLLVLLLAGGGAVAQLKVRVMNPLKTDRDFETVEVPWERIEAAVEGATPARTVVCDAAGRQLPSQAVYEGGKTPRALIFQVALKAREKADFTICEAERETYPQRVYGRYVPERMDDYAWENDRVAFRIYGPALERELVTPGIDVWVKRTQELVIDKWYELDLSGRHSYHADAGEGNDCYKVGPTLGCGASAPYAGGRLWLSRNYARWERLDNGPVRTTVRLTYAPFEVAGRKVSLVKTISLDARSRFNRIVDEYRFDTTEITVAAGVVSYGKEQARTEEAGDYVLLYEPASDSQSGKDGRIGTAVIVPGLLRTLVVDGNRAALSKIERGKPFVYYAGTGAEKAGVESFEAWRTLVRRQSEALSEPLRVRYR